VKIYHFSLGNSNTGPIGACVEVKAKDKQEALKRIKDYIGMWDQLEIPVLGDTKGILYGNVYFNCDAITEADIDEVRACEDGEVETDDERFPQRFFGFPER
jgi:hypothetical protein